MQQQTKRQPGFEIVLDQEIKSLARRERELLVQLLVKIREMKVSEGYLLLGCSSIHEYLVEKVGYTNGSAQRRIDSARMLKDVPEVGEKIKEGTISMNQVTLIKKAVRKVSKTRPVSVEEKREIVAKIESMGEWESQREVASFFDLPVIQEAKWKVQADGSVRLECTFTKGQAEQIRRAQELVSHSVPSNNIVDFIEYVSARIIAQKTGVGSRPKKEQAKGGKSARTGQASAMGDKNVSTTATMGVEKANTTISACARQPSSTDDKSAAVTTAMAVGNAVGAMSSPQKLAQEQVNQKSVKRARSTGASAGNCMSTTNQNIETRQRTFFDGEKISVATAMAVDNVKTKAATPARAQAQPTAQTTTQSSSEVHGTQSPHAPLSLRLRKQVLREEPTCQYRDPKTGQKCGSRWMLQVDHRRPRWAGGDNSRDNLQTLCARHNRLKYRREANLGVLLR